MLPFREGNGRTARLYADLIAMKREFERFNFEMITDKRMPECISAVQTAADKNYEPMTTAAAIDRLVHHSIILELNLSSYRLESSQSRKNSGQEIVEATGEK